MRSGFERLDQLLDAIHSDYPVVIDDKRKWRHISLFRKIFPSKRCWKLKLAHSLSAILDGLEKFSVRFSKDSKKRADQTIDFEGYLKAAQAVEKSLKFLDSKESIQTRLILKRRMTALHYRLGRENRGLDISSYRRELHHLLMQNAYKWKQKHPVLSDEILSSVEQKKIYETSHYPEFAKLLLEDAEWQETFFTWIIRDRNDVRPFIEFPALAEKLTECNFSGRIGRLGSKLLKIRFEPVSDDIEQKIVTLPFEGNEVNILDEQQIYTFRGNFSFMIKEVFEVFRNKIVEVGDLEFLANGINNWNVHHWGWWDADNEVYRMIDFNDPEWWKQLPSVGNLTIEQAQKRYGKHLNGRNWNVAAIATRKKRTLAIEDCHAFIEVAIPIDNGHYAIYPMGKYATDQPLIFNVMGGLQILCNMASATVAYPDENIFYTFRQHTNYSFAITREQGYRLMARIKHDMHVAQQGNFIYQIEADNCAKWVQTKLEWLVGKANLPNLFTMSFLDTEPEGPTEAIFWFVKLFPKKWRYWIITRMHLPFGATKGRWVIENGKRKYLTLSKSAFWNNIVVYHPSLLHQQQEQGFLGRVFGLDFATTYHYCRALKKGIDKLSEIFQRKDIVLVQIFSQFHFFKFITKRIRAGPSPPVKGGR